MEKTTIRSYTLGELGVPEAGQYHIYRICCSNRAGVPHTHDYYNIVYVDCGRVLHRQGTHEVSLSAGDAFIIPPGVVHSIVFSDPGTYIYSLSFQGSLVSCASVSLARAFLTALDQAATGGVPLYSRLKISLDPGRQESVLALLQAILREDAAGPAVIATLVEALLCLLADPYFEKATPGLRLPDIEQSQPQLLNAIDYLNLHFAEDISVAELSHRFGMSRSLLSGLFKQYTGMPPKRYLTRKRLEYAAFLIHASALPVTEIARLVGYEDFSTFYRSFKQEYGVSPSAMRRVE